MRSENSPVMPMATLLPVCLLTASGCVLVYVMLTLKVTPVSVGLTVGFCHVLQ